MNRDEVWQAIDDERLSLADLFDDLSAAEWETASLCDGWRVRDVAAHLTLAQLGTFAAALATLRGSGTVCMAITSQIPTTRTATQRGKEQ